MAAKTASVLARIEPDVKIQAEFDTMMSRGYADALAGHHEDVDKVFDELDEKIDAQINPQ